MPPTWISNYRFHLALCSSGKFSVPDSTVAKFDPENIAYSRWNFVPNWPIHTEIHLMVLKRFSRFFYSFP